MKFIYVLCVALFGAANAKLLDLTKSDFEDVVIKSGKASLVKFYAPWCGHCKRLAPVWDQLAEDLDGTSSVQITRVDCTQHQEICTKNKVTGYPTLKYFKDGATVGEPYNGGRSLENFKLFVKEKLESGCDVSSPDSMEQTCKTNEKEYFEKMKGKPIEELKKEADRITEVLGKSMSSGGREWFVKRKAILDQMLKA